MLLINISKIEKNRIEFLGFSNNETGRWEHRLDNTYDYVVYYIHFIGRVNEKRVSKICLFHREWRKLIKSFNMASNPDQTNKLLDFKHAKIHSFTETLFCFGLYMKKIVPLWNVNCLLPFFRHLSIRGPIVSVYFLF